MGSSKKTTVGYRYYIGMHNVLCHGPIDAITEIRCGEKVAYRPYVFQPISLNIQEASLFGGDSREGGVSGTVDLMFGYPDQAQNAYLQTQLGTDIPAYRGVTSMVFNQFYMGNNPYLKSWDFTAQRVWVRQDGLEQWYIDKAPIGELSEESLAIYFALDFSSSMLDFSDNGQQKYQNLQTGLEDALLFIKQLIEGGSITAVSIQCKLFTDEGSIVRNNCTATDVQDIINYVNAQQPGAFTPTSFANGFADVSTFFGANPDFTPIMVLLTDGAPSDGQSDVDAAIVLRDAIADNVTYGVQLDDPDTSFTQQVAKDNIVPVINGSDTNAIRNLFTQFIYGHLDLNPAHIIRECLTDPDWGMGYPEVDMDDTAFEAAADTLFLEEMGISLLWDQQIEIEDFISEILSHIDANLYVSRTTGKFVLKLIRDDYDEGTLLTLNEDNIKSVKNYQRINPLEAVNTVVVNYWDWRTGETSSVYADNLALIQDSGTINSTTIKYDGFTNATIAGRVADRDLKSLSSPLLSCDIVCDRTAADLNIGDVFKFEWPDYHSGFIIMRVADIKFGKNDDAAVKIKCTQDVFSLPSASRIGQDEGGWQDPSQPPVAATTNIAEEANYYELAQNVGDSEAQSALDAEPDAGYLVATSDAIPDGTNGVMYVDDGTGYAEAANYDFAPSAVLQADIGKLDTVLSVSLAGTVANTVELNTYAIIGGEYVSLEAVDTGAGTITVGRGVLDQTVQSHLAGTGIYFVEDFYSGNNTQYLVSESLDVKLTPITSQGALDLAAAPVTTVVMNSRAIRPYPPGNVQYNGAYFPTDTLSGGADIVMTWATRNRLQQTSGTFVDFTEGDITPEVGTTYTIRVYDTSDESLVEEVTGIALQTYTLNTGNWPGLETGRIELYAVRDGYESWTSVDHDITVQADLQFVTTMNVVSFVKVAPFNASTINVVTFVRND